VKYYINVAHKQNAMYNFPSIRKTGDDGSTGLNSGRIQRRPIYQAHHGQSTNYVGGLHNTGLDLGSSHRRDTVRSDTIICYD
jgi:hypothetical protein